LAVNRLYVFWEINMTKLRKWTKARRVKYNETIKKRNGSHSRIKQASHFYRLVNGELKPVKVKKLIAWVIE
jgi:hypothetical protein